MSESRECYLCHRIGYRGFVQYGDWAWCCFRDDLCRSRVKRRERDAANRPADQEASA